MKDDRQIILNVMFEILSRCHARQWGSEQREELMAFAREQLCKSGIIVHAMGSSHAVIRKTDSDLQEDALSFIMTDFEFLHASHMDRMARVKRFLDLVGLKLVPK